MLRLSTFLISILFTLSMFGQSSADILHELKKLQTPVRVLYLAAHPDDENTRMISWLANDVGAQTAYMSLTRGDGGQNLIGTELSEKLGILRTQELMQARNIDGGQQFFSRAVDFGYSKTADETFEKWGKETVLGDVVWVIRNFRPHIIITRFPPDERAGHGHHTASAMLGIEAFDLAGKKEAYPEQLQFVTPWQPTRIYWNSSNWWNRNIDSLAQNNSDYLIEDIGTYIPVLGVSSNELASLSRTQHKSQGFGVSVSRGSQKEYLKYLAGEKAEKSIFDNTPLNWENLSFKEGDKALAELIKSYDPQNPSKSVSALLQLKKKSESIANNQDKIYFQSNIDEIIISCLGIHAELLFPNTLLVENAQTQLDVEVLNRSDFDLDLNSIKVADQTFNVNKKLLNNEWFTIKESFTPKVEISQPYWLKNDFDAIYQVNDQTLIGKPENDPSLTAELTFQLQGQLVKHVIPATYKHSERVEGEIVEPVFVVPQVTVSPATESLIYAQDKPQEVSFEVQFNDSESLAAQIELQADGWEITPSKLKIEAVKGTNKAGFTVKVLPQSNSKTTNLKIWVNGSEALSAYSVSYPHIQNRIVFSPARLKLNRFELKATAQHIGYIPGAGDKVAEAIMQMGLDVEILSEDQIRTTDLSRFDAIVAGIRTYNTQEWLPSTKPILMEYVQDGGNYIVQYNTSSRDLLSNDIGPYPFTITRNRVTEEDAAVKRLLPESPVFNTPNILTAADFEGWVQERGLYFAGSISKQYQQPIGWHDKGETSQNGGLIIAHYGKGTFMYTGISFFRELPAGVPGAYRLLANLLSYKNTTLE